MKRFHCVVAAALFLLASAAIGGPSQTGQSIMVNLHASGTFARTTVELFKFNDATAAAYFTNAYTGSTSVSCSGSPVACGAGNRPAAPAPPAADASQVTAANGVAQNNKCNFLDGAPLSGRNYTQSVTVNGLDGHGNFTFTYGYAVTPTVASTAPFTAWDLVHTTGGGDGGLVPITAEIAGESVVKSSNAKLGTKYTCSLLDSLAVSRVTGLQLSVDGTPAAWPNSSVHFPVDFNYAMNAGSNGNTSLLRNGNARTILNTDGFAGNDNGGADGSALAQAVMDEVDLDLAPGYHTVTLSGTVKDNTIDGTGASISFTVSGTIHIVTPGCSGNNN